jgi:hypothetical protein
MDYNQYLKSYQRLIENCMSELFGTDQDGKPIPRDENAKEPWYMN